MHGDSDNGPHFSTEHSCCRTTLLSSMLNLTSNFKNTDGSFDLFHQRKYQRIFWKKETTTNLLSLGCVVFLLERCTGKFSCGLYATVTPCNNKSFYSIDYRRHLCKRVFLFVQIIKENYDAARIENEEEKNTHQIKFFLKQMQENRKPIDVTHRWMDRCRCICLNWNHDEKRNRKE